MKILLLKNPQVFKKCALDPDMHQNEMNPKYWFIQIINLKLCFRGIYNLVCLTKTFEHSEASGE